MIKIPYEQIILKIKEQSKLTDEDIETRIRSKMDQLAGLISKEGAAHILANELGVKLFEEGRLKIKDIMAGMRSVETVGKITNVFDARDFERKDGSKGKVLSFVIADDTGSIRVVLWNDQVDKYKGLESGVIVKIRDAYVKENNTNKELHLGIRSELILNPEGESLGEIKQKLERKSVEQLTENSSNIELLGTIIQVFEPKFYEVCPECNRRLKQKESSLVCDKHGAVEPQYSYVMNIVLDDGTSTIRTVFFRNQLLNLLKINDSEIMKFKDNPAEFQTIKNELLGNIIRVVGRTVKNELFNRLEFIPNLVYTNPDPDDELLRLEKEAQSIE